MLFTRCILDEPKQEDGFRISVMRCHTLNDGRTPDIRLVPSRYHLHLPELSPSRELLGDYYRRGLLWEGEAGFAARYLKELKMGDGLGTLRALAEASMRMNITLLCIEESPEYCHRRLLAAECRFLVPWLDIVIG